MMMHNARRVLGFAMAFAAIAFGPLVYAEQQFEPAVWVERGESTLAPFKKRLMGALIKGLEDGPEAAVEVCQLVAPEIAAELSTAGVELGRTSHKLRNPRNAPQAWVQPLLDDYVATPGKTEPEVVRLDSGAVGYVEPIFVQPMCLACHGRALSPGVAARIDGHYPQDQARGFEVGDFRGLFWVEFTEPAVERP
ncbi:MAG: DUF3365 domain-containing protein [Pseudomonadota bacterium]|nr:DUF3365 domain-containing protein [Pseudomonadota bacterium]